MTSQLVEISYSPVQIPYEKCFEMIRLYVHVSFEHTCVIVTTFIYWTTLQANTYQAVAITDGLMYSYAIFIYECGGIQWGGEAAMGSIFARVGISIGGNVIFSHSLSGNDRVDTIDCLNDPTSRWVNLLYDISLIRPSITSGPLPHTMSMVSSAVLVESSQFRASSSLFVGSGTTTCKS